MLDVQFKRNSDPIDDEELQSVTEAIQAEAEPLNDLALLLAKMVLRIRQAEALPKPVCSRCGAGCELNSCPRGHADCALYPAPRDSQPATIFGGIPT